MKQLKFMKINENLVVTDTRPGNNWRFDEIVSEYTGLNWTLLDGGLQYKLGTFREKAKRYSNLICFPFQLFINRKKFHNLIAWQQYYGLMYAFYCMIFRVKKRNYCMIMTFIYRQRSGCLGWLQKFVATKILNSKYIDRVLVFSSSEREYYQKIFGITGEKFISIKLGLEDLTTGIRKGPGKGYILSAGRSNRDYSFLINALVGEKYQVKIVCDALPAGRIENIQILDNVYYEHFFQMIADCYCVVIALKDSEISSGQLVILQAMQFGKPVIVTKSKAVTDYVTDGEEGFIIPKEKSKLMEKLDLLFNDKKLYVSMCENARACYEKNFSMRSLAKQVADCYVKDMCEKNENKDYE